MLEKQSLKIKQEQIPLKDFVRVKDDYKPFNVNRVSDDSATTVQTSEYSKNLVKVKQN